MKIAGTHTAQQLHEQGAATWGYTREEALKSIEEVVHLVIESMVEHNEPLPQAIRDEVEVTVEPPVGQASGLSRTGRVAVTV